jgi:hypothetical protein
LSWFPTSRRRFWKSTNPARAQGRCLLRALLGSIVISQPDEKKQIVDGQQRLTSLTLLLIYLHNIQKDRHDAVPRR